MLATLARRRGAVVSHSQLSREVWGHDANLADHLRVHIAALRKKIEKDPSQARRLVTVIGLGYRLMP